jgi:hypothetical protein
LRITLKERGERVVDHWFHARGHDAASWRVGHFEFSARWVHWREDAQGRLLHAISHAGAVLPRDRQTDLGDNRGWGTLMAPAVVQRSELSR